MHSISHRPAFVEAHPHLKALHRDAQCAMFAAANAAGLPTGERTKDAMLEGINAAFNRIGSRRLISRKQLKIEEMEALTAAIDAGLFSPDWTWGHDFMIYVRTATVRATIRLATMHFEPLNTPRARQWSHNAPASADEVRAAYEKYAGLVNYCIDHPAYETDVVSREIERLKSNWRRLEAMAQASA